MIELVSLQSGPSNIQEFAAVFLIAVVAVVAGLASKSILIGMIAGCMAGAVVEMGLFLICGLIVGGALLVMIATVAGGILGSLAGGLGRWWKARRGG